MKYAVYIIFVVMLLGLNVGFFSYVRFYGAGVNFLLILAVLAALQKDFEPYMVIAATAGVFLDFYTGIFFGSYSLAFIFSAFLIRMVTERVAVNEMNWKYLFGSLLFGLAFTDGFVWIYNFLAAHLSLTLLHFAFSDIEKRFVPEFLYNALFAYPLYFLFSQIHTMLQEYERNKKFK